ncbi:hypothetical protein ACT3TS_01100 [Specibacter sp. AOP5-B1-6]|uniref:hypothetical protein n=1 Tax=Specibacter sp. AOP5-B1-6 TaxID=3457653 RepID=UPI00402B8EA0
MTASSIPAGKPAHTRRPPSNPEADAAPATGSTRRQRLVRLTTLRRQARTAGGIQTQPTKLRPHESLPMLWAGHLGGPP